MSTLKEIARECGVSTVTVSNILNGKPNVSAETKKKVLEVVKRTGYRPNTVARNLRRRSSMTIAVIAEDVEQFTTPEIVEGIMSFYEKKGYSIVLKNLRLYARWQDRWYDDKDAFHSVLDPVLSELRANMVDGIIYIAGHARSITCFKEESDIPFVMTYGYSTDKKVPSIVLDDTTAAYEIVNYLISKGHKKIGVIGGYDNNMHTHLRLAGYKKALKEAGIKMNRDYVKFAGWELKDAYSVSEELVSKGVTAVFCMCDRLAGGLYKYLAEKGIKPGKDISVAGFDNQDIAEYFVPGLTTTALPLRAIGTKAAEKLIKIIKGSEVQKDNEVEYVPLKFIERSSVCKID